MTTTAQLVLKRISRLRETERQAIIRALTTQQSFPANHDVLNPNAPFPGIHLILSGFACRYAVLQGGQRQILAYLVPGDVFDVGACFGQRSGSYVQSLSALRTTTLPLHELLSLAHQSPELVREFWRQMAVEEATTRQWQLNVGRRSAIQRLSHLLCECFTRLRAVGLANGDSCPLPMTQADIADALALTPVHINRTLSELRKAGLAVFKNRQLTILDAPALYAVAEFEPDYLQVEAVTLPTPSEMTAHLPGASRPSPLSSTHNASP